MKNNSKSKLYADDHPESSTKGTGFKDENIALNTIKIISKRCLKYQFDVVNTMYNRAKYHPNQSPDMKKAMLIFKHWLTEYKEKKEIENKIKNIELLDFIHSRLNYLDLSFDKEIFNNIKHEIKDKIRTLSYYI